MDATPTKLNARPVTLKVARAFCDRHHRHHKGSTKWRWGVAVLAGGQLVGVAMCGRPNAKNIEQYQTIEVLRVCTDGTRNACSFLYGACRRIARAFGYDRVITYTLESENGASLRAAGFVPVVTTEGGSWDRPSRRRQSNAPTEPKVRWEAPLK